MIIDAFMVRCAPRRRRLPCWCYSAWEAWIARVGDDVFQVNRCTNCGASWEYNQDRGAATWRDEVMGRPIIKLNDGRRDWYLVWSSVVDAPITRGMDLADLTSWIREKYGAQGLNELDDRLARVELKGTSDMHDCDVYATIACNRAGAGETCLTYDQLIAGYCNGWHPTIIGHKHADDGYCDGRGDYR